MGWWFGVAISLGLVAFGAVLLGFAVQTRIEASESAGWSPVAGRVVESRVEETSVRVSQRRSERRYRPVVRYEYVVAGSTYTGDRIAFDQPTYDTFDAANLALGPYRVGSAVVVHVDPDRPERSVLKTGWSWGKSLLVAIAASAVIATGFLFLWLARRSPERLIRAAARRAATARPLTPGDLAKPSSRERRRARRHRA